MFRVITSIGLLLLVSCASFPTNEGQVISRPFSAVDADRKIVIAPNYQFEIVLQSNPSTGYDWVLEIDNPSVVSASSFRYIPDRSGRVGVGGETIWSLQTKNAGEAVLTFAYQRSWESAAPPTRIVSFTIEVR